VRIAGLYAIRYGSRGALQRQRRAEMDDHPVKELAEHAELRAAVFRPGRAPNDE
jgi:hypothetical protein